MLSPGPAHVQISQEQGEGSLVGICHKATFDIPHDHTWHQLQALPWGVEPPLVGKVTLLCIKNCPGWLRRQPSTFSPSGAWGGTGGFLPALVLRRGVGPCSVLGWDELLISQLFWSVARGQDLWQNISCYRSWIYFLTEESDLLYCECSLYMNIYFLFFFSSWAWRCSGFPLYDHINIVKHERERLGDMGVLEGSVSWGRLVWGGGVQREQWGRERPAAGARWPSLTESVTCPRGPVTPGLFSILILIGRQLQSLKKFIPRTYFYYGQSNL